MLNGIHLAEREFAQPTLAHMREQHSQPRTLSTHATNMSTLLAEVSDISTLNYTSELIAGTICALYKSARWGFQRLMLRCINEQLRVIDVRFTAGGPMQAPNVSLQPGCALLCLPPNALVANLPVSGSAVHLTRLARTP